MQQLVGQKTYSLGAFSHYREIHEKGIKKFKENNTTEDEGARRRKRAYSIHTELTGAYYLNNWISHEDMPC